VDGAPHTRQANNEDGYELSRAHQPHRRLVRLGRRL